VLTAEERAKQSNDQFAHEEQLCPLPQF